MFKQIQYHRISATVALAAAGIAISLPATSLAQEQDVAQEQEFAIEEIIVTAQRRAQSMQDVSVSISAFSADALDTHTIEDMADLQFSVPNVMTSAGFEGRIAIRGVGNNASSSSAEDGLGYHVNGVFVNRPQIDNTEYFDVERVEVLRGPQGTLYGRNTTAGVVNVITKKPTDELSGDLSVTLGNYNTQKIKGAFNIPISDKIGQRFAGLYLKRDGYNKNIYTGNDVDGRDAFELRSSTSFDFSDNFSANLVVSYLKEDSNRANETKGTCTKDPITGCSALSAGFESPDTTAARLYTLYNEVFIGPAEGVLIPLGDYFANTVNPADYRTVNIDQEPTYEVEQLGISLEFNFQAGDYNLTSLTGYYDTDLDFFADFDRFATDVLMNRPVTYRANGRDVITTNVIQSGRRDYRVVDQFTQEFRVASDYDGKFNFLLGAFYYEEDRYTQALITHPLMARTQQLFGLSLEHESFNSENFIDTESFALFGETYFDLSEQTRLTVGLRYTDDQKGAHTTLKIPVIVNSDNLAEQSWQETTGKVTIEHFFNDDSMVFATVARGYKGGGVNPGQDAENLVFDPEFVNAFEVGSKNTFLDGRLRANFGAFFYDYEDMQVGQVSETATVTTNADSTVMGAEGEFVFAATDALVLDLNVAWLDLEINDFESGDEGDPNGIAPGTVPALDENGDIRWAGTVMIKNLDGNAVRNAPEFSVKIGAQYTFNVSDGYELTARVNHYWQDAYWANEFNKPSDAIDAWEQTDIQLVLLPTDANWSVKAFAKNVADGDDVTRRGQDGPLVGRFRSVNVLEPRTYGIEFRLAFE
jgi:outer membrane receptor protein involved in Fe transport